MRNLIILSFIVLFGFVGIAKAKAKAKNDDIEKHLKEVPTKLPIPDFNIEGNKMVNCSIFGTEESDCAYINLTNIDTFVDVIFTNPDTKEKVALCKLNHINSSNESRGYALAVGSCAEVMARIHLALNK